MTKTFNLEESKLFSYKQNNGSTNRWGRFT